MASHSSSTGSSSGAPADQRHEPSAAARMAELQALLESAQSRSAALEEENRRLREAAVSLVRRPRRWRPTQRTALIRHALQQMQVEQEEGTAAAGPPGGRPPDDAADRRADWPRGCGRCRVHQQPAAEED